MICGKVWLIARKQGRYSVVKGLFSSRERGQEKDEVTIHVRKNGSRYVDPDEYFRTPGIRKLVEDLKDIDVKPNEKIGA